MEAKEPYRGGRVYSGIMSSEASVVCREVSVVLDRLGHVSHLGEEDEFDVRVILCELLQNAIRHGNCMDCGKSISLDVTLEGCDCIEISVEDEGNGFDAEQTLAQKKTKALDTDDLFDMDEFGRGLLIIETLCDDIWRNETGNRVTIRKQLHLN